MKRFLARHSPLVMLAGLCLALALISPGFRRAENLQNVALRTCVISVMAAGQVLVILTGGIDLSVSSVAALSGVVGGIVLKKGVAVGFGIAAGTLTGLLCGLINGALATRGRIPAFIVTLGMMMSARGAAMLLSGAKPVFGLPEAFDFLGGKSGWYIPVAITFTLVLAFAVILGYTRYGRSLFAIGGNLAAARLSGINVNRERTIAFALCGAFAGFAGVMLASRTGIADPSAAEGYELDAIAACVIGGASLMGGEGGTLGALAGALIMNVLVNFCNLNNINVHWQRVLVGSLIVALVYYDTFRKRKAGLIKE